MLMVELIGLNGSASGGDGLLAVAVRSSGCCNGGTAAVGGFGSIGRKAVVPGG
jgi:hypothetical protein